MYSRDDIAALLERSDKAVYRALEVLLDRQTADEQAAETTNHLNGMGFNGRDAKFGTSLAKQVIAWREGDSPYANPLSPGQLTAARRMLRKYAGQLARVANGEEVAA